MSTTPQQSAKDTKRLDWLENQRLALNQHCGSSYGWEVVQSHLVNRLMFKTTERSAIAGVDVNDTGPKGIDIRAAIDAAMAAKPAAGQARTERPMCVCRVRPAGPTGLCDECFLNKHDSMQARTDGDET
jgi:hypothetical protein